MAVKTKLQIQVSDYKKFPDDELVYRYVNLHDNTAINYLYERYGHLVFGVCLKYLKDTEAAKDTTQQIFIKMLDDLNRFHINNFKPWLFKVTKNTCLMQLRSSLPVVNNKIEIGDDMDFEQETHQKIEQEEKLNNLETALSQLCDEQRICIELFYLQKLTYAEIVQRTDYTLLQVKSFIQNGKRNLKIKMEAFQGMGQ